MTPFGLDPTWHRSIVISGNKPTPKEQILFLYILSGQGRQLHSYRD